MNRVKLNRLSEEVVRQIAAGEVVERPASVVKELIDNSIDAKASKISLKIDNGGIDMIEVSDNGIGIPKENFKGIFEAHTTSKLQSIEDLNNLLSMGFRGEALSTISSISKVSAESRYEDDEIGSKIFFDEEGKIQIAAFPKEEGTSIRIKDIFFNVPARRKYLKTPNTEYRKIFELLTRYFLIYPNISFEVIKDGKRIASLPSLTNTKAGEIADERLNKVLGGDIKDSMLEIKYEGNGLSISGYISHPNKHSKATKNQYIFVNNRGITDRGITRAVMEGFSRYIPFNQKIDFILNLIINPDLVDVNVHPRKEEVRFENPYRVYSAIEEAVKHSLEKNLSYRNTDSHNANQNSQIDFVSARERYNQGNPSGGKISSEDSDHKIRNNYVSNKASAVRDSIVFSKELFSELPSVEDFKQKEFTSASEFRNIFQVFNKYIVIEYQDPILWIVDQHAAAERINFEKLKFRELNSKNIQKLLIPEIVNFSPAQTLLLKENKDFFKELGFSYNIEKDGIILESIPTEYSAANFRDIFMEIFELEEDINNLKKNFEKKKDDILATISCHGSVRSGQKLHQEEMIEIINELKQCKNPYSCPHGRPIVWELKLSEIDSHFERTY